MKLLILGVTGMLGHVALRLLSASDGLSVRGTARSEHQVGRLPAELRPSVFTGIDATRPEAVIRLLESWRPEVVVNCIGLIKQLEEASDPLTAIPINALFPHQVARACRERGIRLIHISTDCVFDGSKGAYREDDAATARDLYGRSKLLGEVTGEGAVTLRTSIIGPELGGSHSLLEWFLAQQGAVSGYTRAIFSGLPTVELARVIRDHVLPRPDLQGLYHVAGSPISKHELLKIIAQAYGRETSIVPEAAVTIDRSLDASRFNDRTGYAPPPWPELVDAMRRFG